MRRTSSATTHLVSKCWTQSGLTLPAYLVEGSYSDCIIRPKTLKRDHHKTMQIQAYLSCVPPNPEHALEYASGVYSQKMRMQPTQLVAGYDPHSSLEREKQFRCLRTFDKGLLQKNRAAEVYEFQERQRNLFRAECTCGWMQRMVGHTHESWWTQQPAMSVIDHRPRQSETSSLEHEQASLVYFKIHYLPSKVTHAAFPRKRCTLAS